MRFILGSLALAASFVAGQLDQLDKIPQCAHGCVTSYIGGDNIAGCKPADIRCVCSNTRFLNDISCCIAGHCNKAEIDSTIKFASQLCTASGVQTPTELVCNQAGPSSSSSTHTSSTTASSSSAAATATKTGAAAPAYGNAGVWGALLAVAAAL